jgi:hypothetical protein
MNINDSEFQRITSNATSRFDLWSEFLKATRVKTMVEVGVWRGEYAQAIFENCPLLEQYYMIDPWANLPDWNKPYNVDAKAFDDVYDEAMKRTEFASSKRIVLRGRTKDVIDRIPDNSLDFAYIDGDHTLRGITIDLIQLLPKIREGGFIGGDDFTHSPWQHGARFEPSLVCPFSVYFAEAMNLPIAALRFEQFILQKEKQVGFAFLDQTGTYRDLSLNRLPFSMFKSAMKSKLKNLLSMGKN